LVWAQTRTIDNKNCHVTVPADWKQLGPSSAQAPGAKTFMAVVRSITPDDVQMTLDMIKQGQMASLNPKVLDENGKRVLIQTERKSPNGKTTTHFQLMTKANPACQGSVDFDSPSDADGASKIVESTSGAH
jgi:hypothetical protein